MNYTPNQLNLSARRVWQVPTADDSVLQFTWNPRGRMVSVQWLERDEQRPWLLRERPDADVFTMGNEEPTEAAVEQAIADWVSEAGVVPSDVA